MASHGVWSFGKREEWCSERANVAPLTLAWLCMAYVLTGMGDTSWH